MTTGIGTATRDQTIAQQVAQARSRSKLLDRVAGVVIGLAVLVLLVLFFTFNCGVGGSSGPGAVNQNSSNQGNDANQVPSVRHPFFALRFVEDDKDKRQIRAAYGRLIRPDGGIMTIDGEGSVQLFKERLVASVKQLRAMPAFANVNRLIYEDFINRDGETIVQAEFRTQLNRLMDGELTVEWRDTPTLNRLLADERDERDF